MTWQQTYGLSRQEMFDLVGQYIVRREKLSGDQPVRVEVLADKQRLSFVNVTVLSQDKTYGLSNNEAIGIWARHVIEREKLTAKYKPEIEIVTSQGKLVFANVTLFELPPEPSKASPPSWIPFL